LADDAMTHRAHRRPFSMLPTGDDPGYSPGMRVHVALLVICSLAGACAGAGSSTNHSGDGATEAGAGSGVRPDHEAGAIAAPGQVGTELPEELVAELHRQGDDADGRLLTLAPGFIATAACSDCGAPSYLWFMAVRCVDPHHCEVLTEQCEGKISRDADIYMIEFRAVEGGDDANTELCAGYSGSFRGTLESP
jgi:hypothetical protein